MPNVDMMRVASMALLLAALPLSSCSKKSRAARASYVPLAEVECTYGPLITAANHPTPDQHGTGELVGLFREGTGTLWGLPLLIANDGQVMACAPPGLRQAKVTGSIPAHSVVIAAANRPTGWRGGTGVLLLLVRDRQGTVHVHDARSAPMPGDSLCWAPELQEPPQRLEYYRLIPE